MSSPFQIVKRYKSNRGLDLRSSDLSQDELFASGMKNAQYRDSGAIEKRPGYQGHADSCGGYGRWTYKRANPTTGADEYEDVTIDQNLYKYQSSTMTVTYVGSDSNAVISIFYDTATDQYRCQITEGTTQVLDYALGIGFDEASPVTINTLSGAIDALANFTSSITGSTSTPAAFLKTTRNYDLSTTGGALSVVAEYCTQINTTTTNPLATYYGHRNDSDFENVSAVNIQNCMYFASGWNEVMKYDGQTFYRAGLPTPASISSVLAAGAVTGSNYFHRAQYVQYDNAGNIIEGNYFSVSAGLTPAGQSMNVTVANVLDGTGFNTNGALVNGNQVGVTTITVTNSPHTLKVGDTAYFLDGVSAAYVTRSVTAVTATTVTISGAAVNVLNGAAISNNLRIRLLRNKTSATTPSIFYDVVELPNNSFAATQVYNDNKADSALGALWTSPATDRTAPPKLKYITQWNGIACGGGVNTDPHTFFWSDIDGPEYFPTDSNQLPIESDSGDKISGMAQNNEVFYVFNFDSFAVISGNILSGDLRVEIKSKDIGCAAHASIAEVSGALCWLSKKGVKISAGGQIPRPLGQAVDETGVALDVSRIDPAITQNEAVAIEQFQFRRAVGFNDVLGRKYLLYIPCESTTSGADHPNSNSKVYAYDYTRDAWLEWTNINAAGGFTIRNSDLYFQERRYSSFASAVKSITYRRHNNNDSYDYQDNAVCVGGTSDAWEYDSAWESLGEPSVRKKFIEIKVFSLEEVQNNTFNLNIQQEVNYQREVVVASFNMSLVGVGYGQSAYGVDPYGDPTEGKAFHSLNQDRIFSIRLKFKNSNEQENVILTAWEIKAAAPYRIDMKS